VNKFKYPLASSTWDEKEIEAMQRVISRGHFTMGNETLEFENKFASYLGVKHCVMVNSGSSANLLMVATLMYSKRFSLKEGDEVIVPAVSWSTTYFPFSQFGLKLVFVDVESDTYNIDCGLIIKSITDRTRVICAVNLLGNPCDFDLLREICDKNNILLIEDNCESLGAMYGGKHTGTFGLLGSFSFFFSHHISTMEGGMIATDDEELFHILLALRAHGWTRNLPHENQVTNTKDENAFNEAFNFVLPGYNLRPLELSAAIGIEQLEKLPKLIEGRRKNASYCRTSMQNFGSVSLQREVGTSSWFAFGVLLDESTNRGEVLKRLEKAGIECRPIAAGNFAKQPVISYLEHRVSCPLNNADRINTQGLFFGNSHLNLTDEIDLLISILCS